MPHARAEEPPNLPQHVRVGLEGRGYDIRIGRGLIAQAGPLISPLLASPRVIVIADATVSALYAAGLRASLEASGIRHDLVEIASGEASKSFAVFGELMERLLALKPDRRTTILALGGGVVGDLAGFAASVLLRGVPFIQLPTTLLAQVDSSVGGKTGINASAGKNLIGSFYQPRLVLADIGTLDTLPRRELLAGYAEIVKYGLLGDDAFFSWLESNGAVLLAGDEERRIHAIRHACAMKARIVAADEHEAGERALLNLGHTFGHALEKEAGYDGRLLHGEGVALGMLMAFALSARRGLVDSETLSRIEAHYREVGLPTRLASLGLEGFDPATLARHCRQDKKAQGDTLVFVLARGIGKAFLDPTVTEAEAARIFGDFRE